MVNETKPVTITSPDGEFPPTQDIHRYRWAHAQRGIMACTVEYLGPDQYHMTVLVNHEDLIFSEFLDFNRMRNEVANYGFKLKC